MKWSDLIEDAITKFTLAGIAEARPNAEWLAANVLGVWKRSEVLRCSTLEVKPTDESLYLKLVNRRLKREPLQYIIGEIEFFGLRIYTTPAALIPRPETEVLVEEALVQLADYGKSESPLRVLDIGTGTGAIALAIASSSPRTQVLGIDISKDAIELAEQNLRRLRIGNAEFRVVDLFDETILRSLGDPFDLIVSNPPYISVAEMDLLDREILEHEPRNALTDEGGGYSFYRRIAQLSDALLDPDGSVLLEMSFDGRNEVADIMKRHDIVYERIVKDLSGIDRVYVGKFSDAASS